MRIHVLLGICCVALGISATVGFAASDDAVRDLAAGGEKAHAAADALAKQSPRGDHVVQALTKALSSDDAELRWRAARALGAAGPAAASAVESLKSHLVDDDSRVRSYAAHALGQIGEPARSSVEGLVGLVTDEDAVVRRAAVRALIKIKPEPEKMFPLMVQILDKADPSLVMPALQSLAENHQQGVPLLIKALRNPKSRYWATLIAQEIGPDAAPAVPALVGLLKSDEPEMRMNAIMALGAIGKAAGPAVPAIAVRLQKDDAEGVRYAAAYALGEIRARAPFADAALQSASQSDDPFLKLVSVFALARIHPDNKAYVGRAVETILASLKSDQPHLRQAAVRALVELETPLAEAAPDLVGAIKDDPEVLANVSEGLVKLGSKGVPALTRALKDKDLRIRAARIIGRIGPDAKSAVPALIEQLPSDDPEFCREIHFALASIGPGAAAAVPKLADSAKAGGEICYSACYALGNIGPAAKEASDELLKNLDDEDEFARITSIWALLKIQPGDEDVIKRAVPLLTAALGHEGELVRMEAARALGEIGLPAASASAALRKLLDDPVAEVREAAAGALDKIEK